MKQIDKKNKRKFGEGLCFDKLFFIFVICSILGSYAEQILNMIYIFFKTGNVVWESRTALIYGPFNIVYGAGAVILILFFGKKEYKWWKLLLLGAIAGGSFEYIMSYLQEMILGSISWDYSSHFLNIHGRTSVPYMLVWGIATTLLIKFLYPFIAYKIERIPKNMGNLIRNFLIIFLSVDIFLSASAITRQILRNNNIKPYTFIGEFCDKIYPDEYLKKIYPNMKMKK